MGENMAVTITKSSDSESEIIINNSVKVTISESSFNSTGEMSVEYDYKMVTEEEATAIVNSYFSKVLEMIALKEKHDNLVAITEKIGENQ